jgi:hypothetical protein
MAKSSLFWYNWVEINNKYTKLKEDCHMNSLSDKLASEQASIHSVEIFMNQFKIGSALKKAHVYRTKGTSACTVVKYLMALVFTGKSMFQDMRGKYPLADGFSKDSVYRLLNLNTVNWQAFLLTVAMSAISFIRHLTSEERLCVFVADDTMFTRKYSKKVELASKVFDHADPGQKYKTGYRMLTLGFTDGHTFIPLLFRHLASRKQELRLSESNPSIDGRSCGGRIRREAVMKANDLLVEMLKRAKHVGISARHVLFDCWFANPVTIIKIAGIGLHTVCRLKSGKTRYGFDGSKHTLSSIYRSQRKRRGRSRYLLSVDVILSSRDNEELPAKIVYVRDKCNRKKWIALLSTDLTLSEEEIIALYGKRWDIEVFFKMCKSYLRLIGEFRQLSYDAVTAHSTIVMLRYIMLAVERRKNEDPRSLAEMFFEIYDEVSDIKYEKALLLLLTLLSDVLRDPRFGLTDEQVAMIHEEFMLGIPAYLCACILPDKMCLSS